MPGLTATGFERKTLEQILAEIVDAQKAALGPSINTQADSLLGQINGIIADQLAELWQVAEATYNSQYPDSASGFALDRIGAITGVFRLPATKSVVTVRASGTNGTVLPVGRVVSVTPGGARFVSIEAGTISGGIADILFEAEEFGPVLANTGTLTSIETPVAGWTSATNLADAALGRNQETDEEFRLRRAELLEVAGDATLEAIRSDVRGVDGVTQVVVYENTENVTNADGVPPHAIEVIVLGGDETAIAQAIFDSKAAGIDTHGTELEVIEDSQGTDHDIRFSRPTPVALDVQVEIRLLPDANPVVVGDAIRAALVTYFSNFEIGARVYVSRLYPVIYNKVSGILDIDTLRAGDSLFTLTTDFVDVDSREVATLDSADIIVTVV